MRLVYKGFPFAFVLSPAGLEVKLGPFVMRRLDATDVEWVRFQRPLITEHYSNFWPLKFVTLRRKTGWFRNFVINPPDGEQFIAEARQLFGLPSEP